MTYSIWAAIYSLRTPILTIEAYHALSLTAAPQATFFPPIALHLR